MVSKRVTRKLREWRQRIIDSDIVDLILLLGVLAVLALAAIELIAFSDVKGIP